MNTVSTAQVAPKAQNQHLFFESLARIGNNRTILALIVVAVPLLIYSPVAHSLFVNYDDPEYLNYHVRMGLSWDSVKWAFQSLDSANWQPVTWLGHMLDCQWFGFNPAGHHMSNLLLHCLNAVLLFLVLDNLTKETGRSFLVTLLFAVHPLNVQSVAWIAEKKNLLSTLFLFLAIAAYVRYVRRPGAWRYLAVLVSFALGLMAKPMIVTFPFLLLLLDYWPLHRLSFWPEGQTDRLTTNGNAQMDAMRDREVRSLPIPWLLLEKVPFLVLAAADAVITMVAQKSGNALTNADFSLPIRFENAAIAYVSYIFKMFWPTHLAVFYPHPGNSVSLWTACLAFLALLVATGVVLWNKDKQYMVTGWLLFVGTLVPVIGLVQVGFQAMADRYAYLPLIGLFIMLVWGSADLLARFSGSAMRKLTYVISVSILFALAIDTRKQLAYWHDGVALFSHDLAVAPGNYIGHSKLAEALEASGRMDEALAEFQSYQLQHPDDAAANYNLSAALLRRGRTEEAIRGLERTLTLTRLPSVIAHTHWQLGNISYSLGNMSAAQQHYRAAVELHTKEYGAYMMLGWILDHQGKHEEAIPYLKESVNMNTPPDAAYFYLGQAYEKAGRFPEALAAYQQALKVAPSAEQIQSAAIAVEQRLHRP